MKFKKLLSGIVLILLCVIISLTAFNKGFVFKALVYNFADINDYEIFDNRTIKQAHQSQPWAKSQQNLKPFPDSTKKLLRDLETIALVVIKNDSLAYEQYSDEYTDTSYSNSFSIAKSIVGLLIGCALQEGAIKSLDTPIGTYIPELSTDEFKSLRIVDALSMSSGSNWDESYSNPLSMTTEAYYGSAINRVATHIKLVAKPGSLHKYKSGDTQLLAMVLAKATGKTLSQYASEKLWQPLGAEQPALWSLDHKNGTEKAYCCFNSNARDFARIGQLMLDSGMWHGKTIIPKTYFKKSISPNGILDEQGQKCDYYGYQWWLYPPQKSIFYARGILGQYIIIIPSKRLVIVRLGKKRSPIKIETVPKEAHDLIQWGLNL